VAFPGARPHEGNIARANLDNDALGATDHRALPD
jgi:hypothetical protein